ncbi:MAG TPA: antitoxin Xre/MbcA/ParS toxin-binding domain-containing protein [Thermoanaerobaculia bacterium]|nr:antitoxin Xre/MbcA/ParS toxin-binding domain-containing protein [Thermoanaerobaculia bacterium]
MAGRLMSEEQKTPPDVERYRRYLLKGRPGPHAYTVLLGMKVHDTERLFEKVMDGFLIRTCEHFQRNFGLDTRTVARFLQTPPRTFARRKQEGVLLPRESDRLLTVARVFGRALDLFEGDREAALRWLREPQPSLADRTPMDALTTELGASEVERLIDRLEHGVYA